MRLEIDNFDGAGVCDYTAWLDAERRPRVTHGLNRASEMTCCLIGAGFAVPEAGARVALRRASGETVFTGYVESGPEREFCGNDAAGLVYRYAIRSVGDEWLLDRELLPDRPVFTMRTSGDMVREITPAAVDVSGVADGSVVTQFGAGLKRWSECIGQVAKQTRSVYEARDGAVSLRPLGERAFAIAEADETFSPQHLKLRGPDHAVDAVTVLGRPEPDAYVKDYFEGDGYSLRFNLSQMPYGRSTSTVFEQEWGDEVDVAWWKPAGAASVNSGRLWMQGAGSVEFAEQVEMRGALTFQHGEAQFQAASDGVIGGLYSGSSLFAGFDVAKSVNQSRITAVINGATTGSALVSAAGHRYVLSTRVFATETVREGERFYSSSEMCGGLSRPADARVVLEVHDIDPDDPQSLVEPATVLFDGVVADVPAVCRYVLLDGDDLWCSVSYTRMLRMPNVTVRSALPGKEYRTRLNGAMMDGAECRVYDDGLQFYSANVPAPGEKIVAEYRTGRRAFARVSADPLKPNKGLSGAPVGTFIELVSPVARTSEDCAAAAKAILDDAAKPVWEGEYETWSDFVPEVGPGDRVDLSLPSRDCEGPAIVREVELRVEDLENDRSWVTIKFANEAAQPIAIETAPVSPALVANLLARDPEKFTLENLPQAQVTAITSTSVTLDVGVEAITGGGFEIRRSDSGWDPQVDRNLVGRFQTRVITVPRLSRVQTYCVRQYDGEGRYSSCATQLHVDYPL